MDATTDVKIKPGLRLLTPAFFVGIGAGLIIGGVVTEVCTHAYLVGNLQVVAGIAVGFVGNLLNHSRKLG